MNNDLTKARKESPVLTGYRLFVLTAMIACCSTATRSDIVILQSGQPGEKGKELEGTIIDYNGRELRLRSPTGRDSVIPTKRVQGIRTSWSKSTLAGDALMDKGEYVRAYNEYKGAMAEEERQWARRDIMSRIVDALRNAGQIEAAVGQFLLLLQSDPDTIHLDSIPLAWMAAVPSPARERAAQGWMNDRRPIVSLIGASWLYSTFQRNQAIARLKELTRAKDIRVALAAEAQLWRISIVTATEADIKNWQRLIDRMPSSLRAGPYYLVGQALARNQKHEEAALALMRVPILYPRNAALASESLQAAGRELERLQRGAAAKELYHELQQRFPESPAAEEARQRAETLKEQ